MNEWIKRSIEIANAPRYLDKLYEVYPVTPKGERHIPAQIEEGLRTAYMRQNKTELVNMLLRLEKFPIDDPYVAFLRKKRGRFLPYNPQTVERIADRMISMGFEAMMKGAKEPKKVSRQSGELFKNWLHKLDYPFLSEQEFGRYKGIAFLRGSNGQLMDYANRILHCDLDKGPDLLVKVGANYIVGEAKFVTDFGGGQKAQFRDAMRLLESKKGNAIRIAILDGVVWIKDSTEMYRTVSQLEETVLTALLIKEFLESLKES